MVGVAAIPSAFLAISILYMPESPRWLVLRGRLRDARQVLDKISDSPEESIIRLAEIKEAAGIPQHCTDDIVSVSKKDGPGEGVWRDLLIRPTPSVRHVLLCGMGIHFFQQASGIDTVVLFSPTIFEKAGITNDTEKLLATIAVGFIKLMFVFVATFMLDRVGRRPLLLTSIAGSTISLFFLAIGFTIIGRADHKVNWAVALSLVSLLSYVSWFAIGMGPITWVYSSEIFPLRLRAQGCSMGIASNRVVSAVIAMTFISLSDAITIGGAFFLYASFATVGWIFFYTLFPETRGRTLEEMETIFGTFFKWRSTMRALEGKRQENFHIENARNGQI